MVLVTAVVLVVTAVLELVVVVAARASVVLALVLAPVEKELVLGATLLLISELEAVELLVVG